MRVGILTYHWVYNFGANLQALSTYSFLDKLGHEVWILNYRPKQLESLYRQRVEAAQAEEHERFCQLYLRQSPVCRSEEDLAGFCREIGPDAILVGSDAVFRLSKELDREDTRFPNPFWLRWVNSSLQSKPLTGALAASAMGANYYSYPISVRQGISDAIRSMAYVSVRDRWTQLMLLAITWGRCRPTLCPDPVVILDEVFQVPSEYAVAPAAVHKSYVLLSVYDGMLSENWVREFTRIAHEHELQVFSVPFPERECDLPVDRIIPLSLSPLGWYAWVQHAAGFVGVRMHPVLCSMVNNVPFLSFDTYQRGHLCISSKTYDLCTRAGTRPLCLSSQQRRDLSPSRAFEILRAGEQDSAKGYVAGARRDFSKTISELLARDS
jgi:hypothetical protein